MNNPWYNLPLTAPYILDSDREWLEQYNQSLLKYANRKADPAINDKIIRDYSLRTEITPFPYYGDPHQATVMVLQANPGHDLEWETNSLSSLILDYDRKNLLHQNPIPLCYTQPETAYWHYNDGRKNEDWYWKRTRTIREVVGWEAVAKRLMYLEMFPYRSIKLRYPKTLPQSQQYTFHLLREALKRNVWVIITRMENHWLENVPELVNYPRKIHLNSKQNVTLSLGNMGNDNFISLCEALSKT